MIPIIIKVINPIKSPFLKDILRLNVLQHKKHKAKISNNITKKKPSKQSQQFPLLYLPYLLLLLF